MKSFLYSRAPSPTREHAKTSKKGNKRDTFYVTGGVYDSLSDPPLPDLPKIHAVMIKYHITFTPSKPLAAQSLTAKFLGMKEISIDYAQGDNMGQMDRRSAQEVVLGMEWNLWGQGPDGGWVGEDEVLKEGKEYTFDIVAKLPEKTPRSISTHSGSISYSLKVSMKPHFIPSLNLPVLNPFSLNPLSPRQGFTFNSRETIDMIGADHELGKGERVHVEFPDQCYKGPGCEFPLSVTVGGGKVHDIEKVEARIMQTVQWNYQGKPFTQDIYPVTPFTSAHLSTSSPSPSPRPSISHTPSTHSASHASGTATPTQPHAELSIPLPDSIHGAYTGPHHSVKHQLMLVFHRKGWLKKRVEWYKDVEIFHRDVGEEFEGVPGVIEEPVGMDVDRLKRELERVKMRGRR